MTGKDILLRTISLVNASTHHKSVRVSDPGYNVQTWSLQLIPGVRGSLDMIVPQGDPRPGRTIKRSLVWLDVYLQG